MSFSNVSRTIFSMYTDPFNPQLVIKVESHNKNPKDQNNFYTWTVIFKIDEGISVFGKFFFNWRVSIYSKYVFLHLQYSLYAGVNL